ncbi:B12-binding domain-containing radical SAM protein [Candidatus Bathyarchaeota archaeon]|nr:B12-binding domain-containing radical SAM protein [Candidatus Bathyarchaeota archaeon]
MPLNDGGYQVVLTADRTLMSEYGGGIFLGFGACVPMGLIPDRLYFSLLCPSISVNEDGSVEVAPCGTRRVEATLLDHGFRREDVIVAHPEHLEKVIGPNTKVLGITENDPLGIGPATSTFTGIFGGKAYMEVKFRELLKHPAIVKFQPKIVVGGPGAWQLEPEEVRKNLSIDCVVIGEGERVVAQIFEKACNGEELPGVVYGEPTSVDEIPLIKGATINGLVEIARGCGRGCDFCVPTLQCYRCFPLDRILKEVGVNIKAGRRPLLHAEDVLRYGAKGIEVNKEAVVNLFWSVRNYPGVNDVSMSHFALASIASAPEVIKEISNILGVDKKHWLSGQTGIETGSPELMKRHMKGKCKPFKPERWPEVVLNAFEILSENNWVPCATLVMGLPGETEKDAEFTLSLIEKLRFFKSLIVPLFLVSTGGLKGRAESFTLDKMTPRHSELFLKCWEHNLKWAPLLVNEWADLSIKNPILRKGLRFIMSYGIKQTMKLVQICQGDYDCNIPLMVRDFRNGGIDAQPLLIRLVHQVMSR